jgi:hypothetical protein
MLWTAKSSDRHASPVKPLGWDFSYYASLQGWEVKNMVVITRKKNVVITRKTNEGVVVGDDIFITVLEVRDDLVRLGIECPKETPFHQGV